MSLDAPRLETLTLADFEPTVGQEYRVRFDGGDVVFRLAEVKGYGRTATHREAFSLMFDGPVELALPQDTYPIANDTLGALEIFIVPVGIEGGARRYQAIFT